MLESLYLRSRRNCLCLAFVIWMVPVSAQEHSLDHKPLQKSPSLSYRDVFESALSNAPELLALGAMSEQSEAYQALGKELFAGNPVLQTGYLDDRVLTDVGLMEFEAGILMPLWRPGQKQNAKVLGQHAESLFAAWHSYVQWRVAGRVRLILLSLQSAEAMLTFEQQSLANSESLEKLSRAMVEAGEAPELDLLATQSMVLDLRNRVHDAEAQLVDAQREYQVVTGLSRIPSSQYKESLAQNGELTSAHPWLSYLRTNVDVAKSSVEQVRGRSIGAPTVGLGYRRERGNRLDEYVDTFGLSLNIPLGKSGAAAMAVSDARRKEAEMQVVLQQARIMLNQQLHEAEHQAYVAAQKLQQTKAKVTLNEQRWNKSKLAYELGETNFYEVLMVLEDLHATEKQRHSLELEIQRRNVEINQSLGVMP